MAGKIQRFKDVTKFEEIDPAVLEEQAKLEAERKEAEAAAASAMGKKVTPKDKAAALRASGTPDMTTPGEFPAFDPAEPNKNKVTPDCVSLELSNVQTMSEMLQYFIHANNLEEEHQFTIAINDS